MDYSRALRLAWNTLLLVHIDKGHINFETDIEHISKLMIS